MTETNRRFTDTTTDINDLIMGEDDPKQRAFLIVLNSINQSLIANTHTIRDVSEKLEQHLTNFENHARDEEAMINKGRGMWKVAAWVIGIAQVIGLGIWNQAHGELSDIKTAVNVGQATLAKHDVRITVLEKVAVP